MAHYWQLTIWYLVSERDGWLIVVRSLEMCVFSSCSKVYIRPTKVGGRARQKKKQGNCSLIILFDNVFRLLLRLPLSSNLIRRGVVQQRTQFRSSPRSLFFFFILFYFIFFYLLFFLLFLHVNFRLPSQMIGPLNYWRSTKSENPSYIDTTTRSGII